VPGLHEHDADQPVADRVSQRGDQHRCGDSEHGRRGQRRPGEQTHRPGVGCGEEHRADSHAEQPVDGHTDQPAREPGRRPRPVA